MAGIIATRCCIVVATAVAAGMSILLMDGRLLFMTASY
jgi:hypothetical protein